MTEYDILIDLVSTIGFPAAVCIWLIFRFEGRIKVLEKALHELTIHLTKLESYISFNEARSFYDHDTWLAREVK